ncbi:ABC transporter substrate-binding protein [Roseibium sp. SCP14]|uniref:ABC transporter substrate-binding protein n=1 Tax=Roseibium sp. SCP14 TaxID=3141375 RepID=UPI0033372B6D
MKLIKSVVAAASLVLSASVASASDDVSGELTILNWLGGTEGALIKALEEGFQKKYPNVEIRDINPAAGGGDARAGIRSALLSGEQFDLLLNTWPSFEKELIDAGIIRDVDEYWTKYNWSNAISDSWRALGTYDDKTYGVYFLAGNRSGLWYRPDVFEAAGIASEPQNWDEFMAAIGKLGDAGLVPVSIGARSWATTEWFENLLLKTAGADFARKLAAHEVKWTDPAVTEVFATWKQMLDANCCERAEKMLSIHWPDTADAVMRDKTAGVMLIGAWANQRAAGDYGQKPGVDYSFFQFPAVNEPHDNTMSIDGKNWLVMSQAKNPDAAAAFIDFVLSEEGSNIIADSNIATPSANVDASKYDPIVAKYVAEYAGADVVFVLDDLLPAELSGLFRSSLQRFVQDPSDETIADIQSALEAKAEEIY